MSDPHDLRELEKDPRLFLYTSLTAGSSHIITATSRLETILKANRVPFQAIDVATDEKARRLWQRRAGKRKLPGLVKDGFVIGDLEEVEEWNEYGELKENIGTVPGASAPVPAPKLPIVPTATAGTAKVTASDPLVDMPNRVALPGAAEIAARNNPLPKSSPEEAAHPETMTSAPAEKEKSIEKAIKFKGEEHIDHLSVPASAIPPSTPTPTPEKIEEDTKAGAEAADEVADDENPVDASAAVEALPASKNVGTSDTDEPTIEEAATVSVEEDVKASSGPAGDAVKARASGTDSKTPSTEISQQEATSEEPQPKKVAEPHLKQTEGDNLPTVKKEAIAEPDIKQTRTEIAPKAKDEAVPQPESKQTGIDSAPAKNEVVAKPEPSQTADDISSTTKSDTSLKDAPSNKTETSKAHSEATTSAAPAPITEASASNLPSNSLDESAQVMTASKIQPAEAAKTPSVGKENVLPRLPSKNKAGTDTLPKQEKSLPSLPTETATPPDTKAQETQKQAAAKPELATESVDD